MPWSHCEETTINDTQDCPSCGLSKSAWTIEIDSTREFVVPRTGRQDQRQGWIEVELLDASGAPVAGAAYRVALPSGRVKKGALDDQGLARLEELPEGECEVSFPDHLPDGVEAGTGGKHTFRLGAAKTLILDAVLKTSRGEPIDNARFAVRGADGETVAEGVTDAEGHLAVPVPAEGDYAIEVLEDEEDTAPDWRVDEGEAPHVDGEWAGAPREEKPWHQRQATSCGAYALAHALRLAAGTLDADQDGTIQQAEWEAVHREAKQIWDGVKFEKPGDDETGALDILEGILARYEYSSPARIAVHTGDSDRLDGFFLAGGEPDMRAWAAEKTASGMGLPELLEIVLREAEAYGLPVEAGDGLERIMGEDKFAIAPCDARSYLHYVLFRDIDGELSVYDSQSTSYEWKPLERKPERGEAFETPGSAGQLIYLGMSVVVSGGAK